MSRRFMNESLDVSQDQARRVAGFSHIYEDPAINAPAESFLFPYLLLF